MRPKVYDRFKSVLRSTPLLWAEGRLQREGHAISVLVWRAGSLMPDGEGNTRVVPARPHGRGRR